MGFRLFRNFTKSGRLFGFTLFLGLDLWFGGMTSLKFIASGEVGSAMTTISRWAHLRGDGAHFDHGEIAISWPTIAPKY